MDNVLRKNKKSLKVKILGYLAILQLLFPMVVQAGYNSWQEIVAAGKESIAIEIGNAAMKQGFNYESTIALLANMNSESELDTTLIEKGNNIGRGLIQWSFGRRTAMENFINEKYKGDFKSMEGQMAFLNYEIETTHKGYMTESNVNSQLAKYGLKISSKAPNSWDEFKKMTNAEDATKVFMAVMEAPSEDPNTNHWEQRVKVAKEMAEALKGKLNGSPSSNSNSGDKVDADLGANGLPKEWELVGMSKRKYLYESQNKLDLPSSDSGLTVKQRQHLASIKEDVTSVDGFNLITFLRTLVAFVGILFFIWAIFLMVAYLFDRSNIFFEVSLVSILTFGSITVLALDETDSRKVNASIIAKRVLLALVIGYVLVAGVMYSGLDWLFQIIQGWINKI